MAMLNDPLAQTLDAGSGVLVPDPTYGGQFMPFPIAQAPTNDMSNIIGPLAADPTAVDSSMGAMDWIMLPIYDAANVAGAVMQGAGDAASAAINAGSGVIGTVASAGATAAEAVSVGTVAVLGLAIIGAMIWFLPRGIFGKHKAA